MQVITPDGQRAFVSSEAAQALSVAIASPAPARAPQALQSSQDEQATRLAVSRERRAQGAPARDVSGRGAARSSASRSSSPPRSQSSVFSTSAPSVPATPLAAESGSEAGAEDGGRGVGSSPSQESDHPPTQQVPTQPSGLYDFFGLLPSAPQLLPCPVPGCADRFDKLPSLSSHLRRARAHVGVQLDAEA